MKVQSELLLGAAITGVGQPKLKRSRRKPKIFPRQMSDCRKVKILKATQLLQKG